MLTHNFSNKGGGEAKKTETPFFSLIIPMFNAERFIGECLNSCISQTFSNIEILVIHDCGNDLSIQIAQKFASTDSRISIIKHTQNLGSLKARLSGISLAKGEYCLFIDSDDFIHPSTCEILFRNLQATAADLLHFGMYYFPQTLFKPNITSNSKHLSDDKILEINLVNTHQSVCNKAFKTSILKEISGFLKTIEYPLCFMEDGLIVLTASLQARRYCAIPNHLYYYRDNPLSMTQCRDSTMFQRKCNDCIELLKIYQQLEQKYPTHQTLFRKYRHKLVSAFIIEARYYSSQELKHLTDKLKPFGFNKPLPNFSSYLNSCILSHQYFKRWQTIIRISAYLFTFTIIKL